MDFRISPNYYSKYKSSNRQIMTLKNLLIKNNEKIITIYMYLVYVNLILFNVLNLTENSCHYSTPHITS